MNHIAVTAKARELASGWTSQGFALHDGQVTDELTPHGALIEAARGKLSARAAAKRAEISEGRWRQIVKGKQPVGNGQTIPVNPRRETLIAMARAVGADVDAVLGAAGMDPLGPDDSVSAVLQTPGQYVGATGERVVDGRREDSEVLQAIAAMSARFDQLDAGQRDLSAGVETLAERTDARLSTLEDEQRELSRRLAQLEESRP